MLEKAIQKFKEYTSNYDMNIMEISLKYYHSFAVSELMGELAFRLGLDKEKIEIARVIGLLHDIGRFEQFMKDHILSDEYSDHAEESIVYLFEQEHIRDFIDDNQYDDIIKTAIRYHNKLKITDNLNAEELLFTKMIRDMDKVDIYKQIAIHYNYVFNAEQVSKEVLEIFKNEQTIPSDITKTDSDIIIQMLAFIFDINFEESFDILVSTDNFDLFLSTVEVDNNSEKLWKKIREVCFDKINRGVSIYE